MNSIKSQKNTETGIINRAILIETGFFLASLIPLVLPAISYGYPLLFSDSGTYLTSGHLSYVPVDRPIIYGLFVRYTSFSWSIWPVVLCQSLIWNYYLYLICRFTIGIKKHRGMIHFILAVFLGLFTGIAYYCSLVMADIFTSISILSIFFLFTLSKKQKAHLFSVSVLFVFSIITHLSHIPLVLSILIFISVFYWIKGKSIVKKKLKRILFVLGFILSSLLLVSTVNYSYGVGFLISRTNNIIFATRFIESGLANKYLKKHCSNERFNPSYMDLCNYVDKFDQWPAAGFYLYDYESSPLYNGPCFEKGWTECWLEKNEEYGLLIKDILSDSELRGDFITLVFSGALKQFFTYDQSGLSAQDMGSIIEKYYKRDSSDFQYSLQNRTTLLFDETNFLESISFWLSFLVLLYIIAKKRNEIPEKEMLLIVIVIFSLFCNALITSTLSNVIARYQGRVIFLIPLAAFCLTVRYVTNNYQLVKKTNQ